MIFDIVVLAVLLISAVIAFLRGFIREVLTIFGVVGGILVAFLTGPFLSPIVRGWMVGENTEDPGLFLGVVPYTIVADFIAYGGVFILVVGILSFISHMLAGWAKDSGLGALDRTLGVVFGLLRGVFLLAVLYLPVYMMVDQDARDSWFGDSKTRLYVESASGWVRHFIPQSLSEDLADRSAEDALSLGETTRQKLQEIDVLRREEPAAKSSSSSENNAAGAGYETDDRQDMKQLFEKGMEE
ncbi:MAG: CvpA family protein [Alphaproteobacteria bacterium]|nr:CvpA family protein [Alphaproteobacteria bacterium]